ncbi:MAG: hypothetical protein K9H84_01045 [Bacteroidales bacterium]|nr:hypothetical protein [Bacteroidales bacterium]
MLLGLLFCFILVQQGISQKSNTPADTTNSDYKTVTPKKDTIVQLHSPKKAARLSAILPGLGQAYNKKYWKIPVIYAALGTSTYFIINNNREYKKYRNAYIARTDNDSTTVTSLRYTTENIRLRREYYHRNLEMSVIITAGLYILNIVDAAVDAHLFYFDVSDDLSVRLQPEVRGFAPGSYNGGIKISLSF